MIDAYIDTFQKAGLSALTDLDDNEQASIANWAQDVADQYGSIIEKHALKINNAADLPFPKETIKIAIKTLLTAYVLKGMGGSVGLLKNRYVRLSTFQEIDPEDIKSIALKTNGEIQSSFPSNTSLMSTHQKYMQVVLSEEKILLEDISTFLNDLD